MSRSRPLVPEPPVARGVLGPALLAGLVMVFVYTAAGAMLGAVAVTLSPGPDTAGGMWDALVWALAVLIAVAAATPVLRRVVRPVAVGAGGGLLLAAVYVGVSWVFDDLWGLGQLPGARAVVMVAAGVLVGAVIARRSGP